MSDLPIVLLPLGADEDALDACLAALEAATPVGTPVWLADDAQAGPRGIAIVERWLQRTRLRAEYSVPASFEAAPWSTMRWMASEDREAIERFSAANRMDMAQDHDDEQVAFFTSDWRRRRAEEEFPMIRFLPVREQHGLAPA